MKSRVLSVYEVDLRLREGRRCVAPFQGASLQTEEEIEAIKHFSELIAKISELHNILTRSKKPNKIIPYCMHEDLSWVQDEYFEDIEEEQEEEEDQEPEPFLNKQFKTGLSQTIESVVYHFISLIQSYNRECDLEYEKYDAEFLWQDYSPIRNWFNKQKKENIKIIIKDPRQLIFNFGS